MKKLITLLIMAALFLSFAPAIAEDEVTELTWWTIISYANDPTDLAEVMEAANAYSAEKIGITVNLEFKEEAALTRSIETGEYYDMVFSCSWANNFDSNALDGYFYDITDLVPQYAPALNEAIGQWWMAGELNGRIYGIPQLKDLGIQVFFRINTDYFEGEKGMTLPESMTWDELEPLLAMWKADHPDEYPIHMTKSGLSGFWQTHQRVVGSYAVIPYAAVGTENATRIIPIWEDETFMHMLRKLHEWYELGYINPDAATTTDLPVELGTPIRSGTAWNGYKGWSNPVKYGFNVKLVQYLGPYMSRASMQGALIGINAGITEEKAIACLKYQELLYTDQHFRDILAYGIEGKHFNYLENGTVLRTEAGSNNYNFDLYCTGPYTTASVLSGSTEVLGEPDQWKQVYEAYENAIISETGAFSYNGEETEEVRATLGAIINDYWAALVTGTADPDEAIAEMSAKMYDVGLQDILDDAQAQLDAYLAGN